MFATRRQLTHVTRPHAACYTRRLVTSTTLLTALTTPATTSTTTLATTSTTALCLARRAKSRKFGQGKSFVSYRDRVDMIDGVYNKYDFGADSMINATHTGRGSGSGSSNDAVAVAEALAHTSSTSLDVNLLVDPSGGLAGNTAEEMTTSELDTHVRLLVSCYVPEQFYLLYTPLVDLVQLLVMNGLLPNSNSVSSSSSDDNSSSSSHAAVASTTTAAAAAPPALPSPLSSRARHEDVLARWFTDGVTLMRCPAYTRVAMGDARYRAFARALRGFYDDLEPVMPLTRVVRAHGLREAVYVPLLRQLAMDLLDAHKRASVVSTLPGLILGLANGRAPAALGLSASMPHHHRVRVVAQLFLGVAQETGSTDLAFLATQLLRANDVAMPLQCQKQLTNVFSSAARIDTDWRMRMTGQLSSVYPKWLEYYKRIVLEQMQRDDAASSSSTTTTTAEPNKATAAVSDEDTKRSNDSSSSNDNTSATTPTGGTVCDDAMAMANAAAAANAAVYYASRRPESVERVAELERNIDAAARARAPLLQQQLQRLQRRRRYQRRGRRGAGGAVAASAAVAAAADAADTRASSPRRTVRTHDSDSNDDDNDSDNNDNDDNDNDDDDDTAATTRHRGRRTSVTATTAVDADAAVDGARDADMIEFAM